MTDRWDGRGLPPVAGARIARAGRDGVRTSLLSADGLAGLEAAGFDVVGEVLGAAVMQPSWLRFRGCGLVPITTPATGWGPGPSGRRFATYEPYRQAVRSGWQNAVDRMRLEAAGLGADGVVAVRLADTPLEGGKREYTALGTAVRSRGRERTARPFTTDLGGPGVVKLMSAGWVPAGIAFGLCVAVTHDDWVVNLQKRRFAGNTEVDGYTALTNHVRAGARTEFAAEVDRLGADGALLSKISLHVQELTPAGHTDHAAECLITGTVIARFRSSREPLEATPAVILSDGRVPGWRRRGMTER